MLVNFNNRELAAFIWLFPLALWLLSKKSIREALGRLVNILLNKKIILSVGGIVFYIVLIVLMLRKFGLWNTELLKNTVYWTISVGVVSFFGIIDTSVDKSFFKKSVKQNFKIIIALEFVVGFYTFPLWVEIVVFPIVIVLIAVQAYSDATNKYAKSGKVASDLLILLSMIVIINAGYNLLVDYSIFAQWGTLTDFTLPIVLSLSMLPVLYLFSLLIVYENAFLQLKFIVNDEELRKYARRSAIMGFKLNIELLKDWVNYVRVSKIWDYRDVEFSVSHVKGYKKKKKNPSSVPVEQGWSPYNAEDYLADEGLATSIYHPLRHDNMKWVANSSYHNIGSGFARDHVAYYLEGDEHVVKSLKLVANFNDSRTYADTIVRFTELTEVLFHKAFGMAMPDEIYTSILTERNVETEINHGTVKLCRESWGEDWGHSLQFVIEKGN